VEQKEGDKMNLILLTLLRYLVGESSDEDGRGGEGESSY